MVDASEGGDNCEGREERGADQPLEAAWFVVGGDNQLTTKNSNSGVHGVECLWDRSTVPFVLVQYNFDSAFHCDEDRIVP